MKGTFLAFPQSQCRAASPDRGVPSMKFQAVGLLMLFCSIGFLAGGQAAPKKEDVPKYLKQLNSKIASERAKAAGWLGLRGGINANDVEDAVEPLKTALQKDKDSSVRAASARALGNIHPDSAETVPLLIDRVKNDSSTDVKIASVVALG